MMLKENNIFSQTKSDGPRGVQEGGGGGGGLGLLTPPPNLGGIIPYKNDGVRRFVRN